MWLGKEEARDERGFDRPDRWRGTTWGDREDPVVGPPSDHSWSERDASRESARLLRLLEED